MTNSVVLLCTAADVDRVNEEVAVLLNDPEGSRNLSREISADGLTVTHFTGHGWFNDLQCKELSQIVGLTVQAATDGVNPRDNWLVALKGIDAAAVKRDEADSKVLIIEAKREPKDEASIVAARTEFEAKPKPTKEANADIRLQ
jgi:hypothetical protein